MLDNNNVVYTDEADKQCDDRGRQLLLRCRHCSTMIFTIKIFEKIIITHNKS